MAGSQRIELANLFGPHTNYDAMPWRPFHHDVDIIVIYGTVGEGPSAALLRYKAGARVPVHQDGDEATKDTKKQIRQGVRDAEVHLRAKPGVG